MPDPAPPLAPIDLKRGPTLDAYAAVTSLASAVGELRAETASLAPRLAGRTVWHVNSTAAGGGVAEMLPSLVGLSRDLGLHSEWVVIESKDPAFFEITKRVHNLMHGSGAPSMDGQARAVFERTARENAARLAPLLRPGDILIVHDPQPVPLAGMLRDAGLRTVWRCHIGLDESNAATRAAWEFLAPYLTSYERAVFSAPEYIPELLTGRAVVIPPGIDPLAPKNEELSLPESVEVLCRAALIPCPGPTVGEPYGAPARRVRPDGTLAPMSASEFGLLTRPIITQISRWDRLKGFLPLLHAFVALKQTRMDGRDPAHRRRLELVRLVLAGPEPGGVADDPEAEGVLDELRAAYAALAPAAQEEIALVVLPMHSVEENALMVNALQRASTLVVQNSLREGFGLTIAEAMWKGVPVLSNSRAAGPRQQIRDGLDGRLICDPEDTAELREALEDLLASPSDLRRMGRSAQRRVHDGFLVLTQLRNSFRLLGDLLQPRTTTARA